MKINGFPGIYSLDGPILVTGHTGFKGTWLSLLLQELEIPFVGMSLKPEQGSLYLRAGLSESYDEEFIDIRDKEHVNRFFSKYEPSAVIHLAAQPLVLKSYELPIETFETNVLGTANLLQAAFGSPQIRSFIGVTTDKVYMNHNTGRRFRESDPLEGKDPYSASKVGTESVLAAWRQISNISGGPKVLSVRAGNVIGGGDFASNRIIPDLVRAVMNIAEMEVRNPKSTRPWQHVLDPLYGYLQALEHSLEEGTETSYKFNFGPDKESLPVSKVVSIFKETFPKQLNVKELEVDVRNFESKNLDLDSTHANQILNWTPGWNQEESIQLTANWWAKVLNGEYLAKDACRADITKFLDKK